MLTLSTAVFMGEREYAVMVFSVVYILAPLFLLMYAARDVRDNPIETPPTPRIKRKNLLYIVATISTLLALFFILYSYFAISYAETIASLMTEDENEISSLATSVVIIGYFFLVVSIILLVGSIGLFFKINFCRYLVILICSYMLIFAFPLGIAMFLCEKNVKLLFGKED